MDRFFLGMLVFIPLAAGAALLHAAPTAVFFLSALAIVPLAKYIGEATDELSAHTGPGLGGILNATFGNATELIIGIMALQAGLLDVVKASITGSIIGNLLLVLGTAMLAGGMKYKEQEFNRTAALASAATMLLAVIALVVPAIFIQTSPQVTSYTVEELSLFVAALMAVVYIGQILFTLWTHRHLYVQEVGKFEARWSKTKGILVLLVATVAVAFMSEILVGAIQPLVAQFGWTELFIGVIFVAIIGNAAEHTSAVVMALKNKMDLALQIAIGSTTQVAMLVVPVLVFVGVLVGHPMNLIFDTFELIAIVLAVLVANLVVEDGKCNWLEGVQLLVAYAIMGIGFFFHP